MPASLHSDQSYWGAFFASLLLHVLIIAMLAFNFDLSGKATYINQAKIIDAIVVDSSVLDALDKKKQQEKARQQKLQAEQKRRQEAERQQRIAQQLEQERLAEERRLAEEKRLQEQARLEEEQRQREQARIAEEQRQREQAQLDEWETLQAEEQAAAEQARARQLANDMNLYEQAIKLRVDRNWIRPLSVEDWYRCDVKVNQIPGGEVVNLQILQCDGDAVFQRSVLNAIYKSSPLPDPPDPALFQRSFILEFEPPQE